jgi:AcrR family transcriptional regulator
MPRTPPSAALPGLRERKKQDKRQRIRAAARELFARQGYDDTTLRQIAQRAHVALGTLFSYAEDKRDLVFLVFNDELGPLTDAALAAPRPGAPLVEQLLAIFEAHYRHFARHLVISRLALQQLTFYSTGKQAEDFLAIRARLIAGIEQRVAEAQRAGQLRRRPDARLIARHIFFLYSAAIRWWIAGRAPRAAQGLAELRQLLQLQIEGLAK